MLVYLIDVVGDLAVTAILAGLVFAYAQTKRGASGIRLVAIGVVVSVIASLVMAYFKQNTSLVATRDWNLGIFIAMLVAALVVAICVLLDSNAKRKENKQAKKALSEALLEGKLVNEADRQESGRAFTTIALVGMVVFLALRVFYKLPNVINYAAVIPTSADNYVSSDFVLRVFAYVLGLVLVVAMALAIYKALRTLSSKLIGTSLGIVMVVITFVQLITAFQILMTKRIIMPKTDLYSFLFPITAWVTNNVVIFTIALSVLVIVLACIVIYLSKQDKEPYRNPAEHRKNKARWRNRRRWSIFIIVCLVCTIATLTVVKDYATQGPQLSESEECEVHDGNVYVSLDQVQDGHLHRFTYDTEAGYACKDSNYTTIGGVGVRFIVIKKPNSTAYGVGLDACEICGQTGYYEREGQVVCKLCDVVMNINTIGFKGGCNPIPFDYAIQDGYIVISTDVLSEYEKTFK